MTDSDWVEAALKQLWAEGVDVRRQLTALQCHEHVPGLGERLTSMPTRKHFNYPAPKRFASGYQLIAIYRDREWLMPEIERLWRGALSSIGTATAFENPQHLDAIAHWRLNLLVGKTQGFSSPETFIKVWVSHQTLVQTTPAEQQVLRWYLANEPWMFRWHPNREGSGAMRRAPLWGAIYCGAPDQAAVAATSDACVTYDGWGVWAATVIAYGVAALWGTEADAASMLLTAMAKVEPQDHPSVKALITNIRAASHGTWIEWIEFINKEFAGYPATHSLPNLLLIIGALLWHSESLSEMWAALRKTGWDIPGNLLITGALADKESRQMATVENTPLLDNLIEHNARAFPFLGESQEGVKSHADSLRSRAAASWPPFGVFLSFLGFRRSVSPSPVRLHRHSRHNMRDAKSMASNRILRDDRYIGYACDENGPI